jgi:hypothetical protein
VRVVAALTVLIIGSALGNQVHAEVQPLTRIDCDRAQMTWDENANVCIANSGAVSRQPLTRLACEMEGIAWNDNANVCGAESLAVEALPNADVANTSPESQRKVDASSQPLTRNQCEMGSMIWNDNANVCDEKAAGTAAETMKENTPVASTILINIDKATQKMTVFLDGEQLYEWPVSTGLSGYTTPSGSYTASSMNKI